MRAFLLAVALLVLPLSGFARAAGPAAVNVVSEATVKAAIKEYLVQKAAPLNADITVKKINYQGDLKLPAGRVTFDVVAPDRWEGYGPASVALVVRVDDQVKKNQTVLVEVEALAEMVVAARTLERGEVLTSSDLAIVKRDLAQVQGRYFNNIDEAVGLRVKSTLRANAPIRKDNLEKVPIVKSGQVVTIVAENDVVRITATGRAKGSGASGDLITVQNLSSQKEIAARVVDATTVKVDF
ncbi:flagellar basal body P-ring formation chaperone FlgA [Geomonas azotofigens]|uniref:flagellar basal body P-ring formation chaperone FlgA n=1 Tax=Geomonas azotofigens TaxID=2843196 RepID=UPI001C12829A|nr:flagellar basal body P-ring formation chaperone FlgA [Geomonas azotofigens]MBU5611498.1 flagellar basal body P-ring formation chaperone FlgA [Geomonas azotofigens]